jgi:hypothetical protein
MAASNVNYFPPYWTSANSKSKRTQFYDVDAYTFKNVKAIVESTWDTDDVGRGRDARGLDHDNINVTRVQRVENKNLFRDFDHQRVEFLQISRRQNYRQISGIPPKLAKFKSAGRELGVNEYYLFHGTSYDAAMQIVEDGFNADEADPKSMFGPGIYFAEKFTKADQYSDEIYDREPEGEELTILLCRVLLGNAFKSDRKEAEPWESPPCMKCERESCSCRPQRKYDSILGAGETMMFREFVVFERDQCYPEFIITYRRVVNRGTAGQGACVIPRGHLKIIERIFAKYAGWDDSVVSILDEFCHKANIEAFYDFERKGTNATWYCVCSLDLYGFTTEGQGETKKIAKMHAAKQFWDVLTSSL